jgi:hypothetical protein
MYSIGWQMHQNEIDLMKASLGLVVAPAGCGKTHLIAESLRDQAGPMPVLVLTHTNAGVAALRWKLDRAFVSHSSYRLQTIDGWAIRLASMFPQRSQVDLRALEISEPKHHYPAIREAAARVLKEGHINECLAATYSRILVDEYQDCSLRQHEMLVGAAQTLPMAVLGDPMQAIFGFSSEDPLVNWEEVVCRQFPLLGELRRPWRWINTQHEKLGEWLLDVRDSLVAGNAIDLHLAPEDVSLIELEGSQLDHGKLSNAARWTGKGTDDRVLIVGDSRNPASRHQLASVVDGASVVEPVELRDMILFLRSFDLQSTSSLEKLLEFAESVMTGVGKTKLLRRLDSLTSGSARKLPTEIESAALLFGQLKTPAAAAKVLSTLASASETRVFRPTVLRACIRSLDLAVAEGLDLHEAGMRIREQFRLSGRPLPRRAVGSTLLLKGLEAEVVVILNAQELDRANLYVALTRGSKAVVVCSTTPLLGLKH